MSPFCFPKFHSLSPGKSQFSYPAGPISTNSSLASLLAEFSLQIDGQRQSHSLFNSSKAVQTLWRQQRKGNAGHGRAKRPRSVPVPASVCRLHSVLASCSAHYLSFKDCLLDHCKGTKYHHLLLAMVILFVASKILPCIKKGKKKPCCDNCPWIKW